MAVELRFLDNIKVSSQLTTNFASEYSEDDRIFIISDAGVYIMALRGYLTNIFSSFSSKNDFFKVSDFIPSANIGININNFHKELNKNDLYEITKSIEYSANLNNTLPVKFRPLWALWSPRGIVGKTDCLLAVLSNLYSLEIYVKYINENEITEYHMICNITHVAINRLKHQWKCPDKLPNLMKLNEMKRRVQSVSCTAFAWSHLYKIGSQEYCAIFVGHMNGDISVWKLNRRQLNSKEMSEPQFLGCCSTQLGKIVMMHWHYTKEYGGGLSFADLEGRMSVLHVRDLDQECASMDNELAFWTTSDNVAVDKISVMIHGDYTYIILVKKCFFIIYGLDESGTIFDQKVCNAENYYITGIHHFDNVLLILTLSGVLKRYTLAIVDKRICLEEKIIPVKINGKKYRTHGLFFSRNSLLIGMVTCPYQLKSLSKTKFYSNVLIFHNSVLNPLDILWHNTSGSLRDYWDCYETLRLLCFKDKRFPWLGLPPDINHDDLSLVQLKTIRWLAKLSEEVFNTVCIIKSYDIKPYIILHYLVQIKLVVQRMNRLLNLHSSGRELSVFQMRSLEIQNFFLKEMVVKNVLAKANVGKNFISEIKHVMSIANELRYPQQMQCIWCGEKIIGPVCLPPHADSRCSISMMPIFLAPAYKCPFCKALAHKEIENEEDVIFCGYCDIPMEKLYAEENEGIQTKDYELKNEEVTSTCFEDCLKEDINFSDIEENESDYIIFSDSEDESGEEQSKLWTLYIRLKDLSLEEIVKLDSEEISNMDTSEAGPSRKVLKLERGDDGS